LLAPVAIAILLTSLARANRGVFSSELGVTLAFAEPELQSAAKTIAGAFLPPIRN
jgi:hypothetical protein